MTVIELFIGSFKRKILGGAEQAMDTSSLCLQLCCAQSLCGQAARSLSDPAQCILSIQIMPVPGPYCCCNDRPVFLFSTVQCSNNKLIIIRGKSGGCNVLQHEGDTISLQ